MIGDGDRIDTRGLCPGGELTNIWAERLENKRERINHHSNVSAHRLGRV